MSASDKKRLRKEQNAATLTEKQLMAQKEAKKLKAYTTTFIVAMVLVVAIVAGVVVTPIVGGIIARNTHAITVGNRELSTTDFSYYYIDTVTNYYSNFSQQYGDYADMYAQFLGGVISTIPLNQQTYDKESGQTWADHFIEEAKESVTWTYAIYDEAIAQGFTLNEDSQKFLDNFKENMNAYATMSGFSSLEGYLKNTYGNGATVESYKEYYTYNTVATEFASEHLDSIEFVNDDFRNHEKDKYNNYSSFSYASYYVSANEYLTFLKLGTVTKDDQGKESTSYSDEDKAKALEAAKKDAEALGIADNNSVEKLNAALAAMDINKDKKDDEKPKVTEAKDILYSSLSNNKDIQKWISDSARKEGDVTVIEYKSKDANDKEVVNGYYVLLFQGLNKNERKLANVRHILVKFTGGTKDKDGNTVYSPADKETAKKKAEDILNLYNQTKKADEDFANLAKEKSEDTGSKSNGGLIENIHRDAGYVDSFTDWALDAHLVGDTGIIETEYGYHVMYYKGDGDLTYRDYLINNELIEKAYNAWQDALMEKVTVTEVNLKGMELDYTIAG